MTKVITVGLLVMPLAFGAPVFAGEGGTLQDRELQKLFEWSAQVADRAAKAKQVAGPGAQASNPIPPVLEHRGSTIK